MKGIDMHSIRMVVGAMHAVYMLVGAMHAVYMLVGAMHAVRRVHCPVTWNCGELSLQFSRTAWKKRKAHANERHKHTDKINNKSNEQQNK